MKKISAKEFALNVKRKAKALSVELCNVLRRLYIKLCMTQKKHPDFVLLWCFLCPAFFMALAHAVIGVWPFGQMSVLTLDLNGQYVFFFEALRDWVYGRGSMLYSFSRSLGGEFLGIYAYYLASPLSYIVALFPKENITEALYFIFVLKCGLCGLTFGILTRRKDGLKPFLCVVFSTMYALIGYGTVMQHNTMWFDVMILMPLIVLGVFGLIRQRKYKLYTISLTVAVMSSFYIGYMMCLFLAFFFFAAYFSMDKETRNVNGERLHFVRALARMLFFSLIAVAMACLIIIPAYYGLTFGKTDFSNPNYSLNSRFGFIDLFSQMLVCSYDTVRPEGLPVVYSGLLSLLMIPLFAVSDKIKIREKISYCLMSLLLIFSFSIDLADKVWHGFQAPNWLNYRYSFMFCFLLIYMASRGASVIDRMSRKKITVSAAFVLSAIVFVQFFHYDTVFGIPTVYASILLTAVYAVILVAQLNALPRVKRVLRSVFLTLICIELGGNAIYDLCYLWDDVGMSSRESYRGYLDSWQPIIDELQSDDRSFYRMEKLPYRRMNDPSGLGYRGVTASTSTLNYKVIAFLEYMGISADSHWSEYCGSSPVTDSLLSIKYVMEYSDKKRVSETYELCRTDGEHDIYLNPYSLPIAFCVSDKIKELSFFEDKSKGEDGKTHIDSVLSVFERMNILLGYMTGSDSEIPVYIPVDYTLSLENLRSSSSGHNHVYYTRPDASKEGKLFFDVKGYEGKEIYLYFPTQHMRDGVTLSIGENYDITWFANSFYGTAYIGPMDNGESETVTLTTVGKTGFLIAPEERVPSYFFALDEELYKNTMSSLKENGLVLESFTEARFKGHITASADKTAVLTSIPYDAGWNVTVDGKRVQTYETLDALLSFDVTEGYHDIEMRYMPDCYRYAFYIFLGGCAALASIILVEFVYRYIKNKSAEKAALNSDNNKKGE